MKILSIGTLKGGVGKTQTTFNIAGLLAEKGKRVLVIDNDPQANLTSNFGIDETVDDFLGMSNIYENNIDIKKVIIRSPIGALPTLDIIPSSIELTRTEMKMVNEAARELFLKKYFKNNDKILKDYDYVIIDTNPSMGVINQNAFIISDSILLVTDVGMNGLKGIQLFTALWEEIVNRYDMKNNIKAVIVNQFRKGVKLSSEFIEYLQEDEDIKDILIDTVIPLNSKLSESELENKTINVYSPTSIGGISYKKLVEELEEKGVL